MNRKQRICVFVGFLLVFVATLFPPWKYRDGAEWGLLFARMPYTQGVDIGRLFLEWLAIALLTGGLFFISRSPKDLHIDDNSGTVAISTKKSRSLLAVTTILTILVLCLGLESYRAVRKVKRLEGGIENVKSTIYSSVAANQGHYVRSGPIPLSPEQEQYNEMAIRNKDALIGRLRQELEGLF